MERQPRKPSGVSLTELFLHGFLREEDLTPRGAVDDHSRLLAERRYADFVNDDERRPRPATARPAAPRVPTRPLSAAAPTTLARLHVVRQRRTATTEERESVPAVFVVDKCAVCMVRDRSHAPAPCYHMCVCATCAQKLKSCPMCRKPASAFHRIFV